MSIRDSGIGATVALVLLCSTPSAPMQQIDGDEYRSPSRDLPPCPSSTEIITVYDPKPVFTWDTGCGGTLLLVEPLDSGADQWAIETDGVNGITSPVEYGVVPPGATEGYGPLELVPGAPYEVILWSTAGLSIGEFTAPVKVKSTSKSWTLLKGVYR